MKSPVEVTNDQAILITDIFPTGYFAADMANIHAGSTLVAFGCSPGGQFAIASTKLMNADRICAADTIPRDYKWPAIKAPRSLTLIRKIRFRFILIYRDSGMEFPGPGAKVGRGRAQL